MLLIPSVITFSNNKELENRGCHRLESGEQVARGTSEVMEQLVLALYCSYIRCYHWGNVKLDEKYIEYFQFL